MRRHFGLPERPFKRPGPVLTLGIFDGVHLGHQAVLRTVVEAARARHAEGAVLTFDAHPQGVLSRTQTPAMITSLEHRLALFEEMGIDAALVLPFREEFAARAAEAFVGEILVERLGAGVVVLGQGARFGRGRGGDFTLLERLGAAHGFQAVEVARVVVRGVEASSTAVREAVQNGRLDEAAALLGRPVSVLGTIMAGAGVGRSLTYPTLNLDLHHELHPPRGVYITRTRVGHTVWPSVTNVGHRPTVDACGPADVLVESHALAGDIGALYGQVAEVFFLRRLRDETRFPDTEALRAAIAGDARAARAYFGL
ncbi:MAG: riboflavin biosynthesis protein RibF [Planctomycetota bacterium]